MNIAEPKEVANQAFVGDTKMLRTYHWITQMSTDPSAVDAMNVESIPKLDDVFAELKRHSESRSQALADTPLPKLDIDSVVVDQTAIRTLVSQRCAQAEQRARQKLNPGLDLAPRTVARAADFLVARNRTYTREARTFDLTRFSSDILLASIPSFRPVLARPTPFQLAAGNGSLDIVTSAVAITAAECVAIGAAQYADLQQPAQLRDIGIELPLADSLGDTCIPPFEEHESLIAETTAAMTDEEWAAAIETGTEGAAFKTAHNGDVTPPAPTPPADVVTTVAEPACDIDAPTFDCDTVTFGDGIDSLDPEGTQGGRVPRSTVRIRKGDTKKPVTTVETSSHSTKRKREQESAHRSTKRQRGSGTSADSTKPILLRPVPSFSTFGARKGVTSDGRIARRPPDVRIL